MRRCILGVILLIFLTNCKPSLIYHNPYIAAPVALRFAEIAFVQKNATASYPMLCKETRKTMTFQQYEDTLMKMHPKGTPTSVEAIEFLPINGQKALNIMVLGANTEERFYYRLIMVGTGTEGYSVGGFFRGSGPYPRSSQMQPLDPKLLPPK